MAKKPAVKESAQYDSFIGKKSESSKPTSVFDFMELDESERISLEQQEHKEWKKHWIGMPEYAQEDNPTYKTIYVHFRNKDDYEEFAKLIGQPLTEKTKSIWHPRLDRTENALMRWIQEDQ